MVLIFSNYYFNLLFSLVTVASASPFALFAGTTKVEHPKNGFDLVKVFICQHYFSFSRNSKESTFILLKEKVLFPKSFKLAPT
jgi:Ni,Fe-hydrogenase I cytochrome b subunit